MDQVGPEYRKRRQKRNIFVVLMVCQEKEWMERVEGEDKTLGEEHRQKPSSWFSPDWVLPRLELCLHLLIVRV